VKEPKVTFISKDKNLCPVCETTFQREEILSGGGRMNAGKLTNELHRNYDITARFGEIFPLIYPVTTCPNCYYSVYQKDFNHTKADYAALKADVGTRKNSLRAVFPDLDFEDLRTLKEGVASYFFALMCYDSFPKDVCPTFKQGQSALRGAWLCKELHKKSPGENYDYLALVFYRKASFFYGRIIELESTGQENLTSLGHLGPDIDKNWGYDGVLYLSGFLEYKYGQKSDPEKRSNSLKRARSTVARLVGMGKSSKSKPSAILDLARDLHKGIKEELEALGVT
jgi:uncharacterized protein (DUF2225 family)